jgi:hypothetical protein
MLENTDCGQRISPTLRYITHKSGSVPVYCSYLQSAPRSLSLVKTKTFVTFDPIPLPAASMVVHLLDIIESDIHKSCREDLRRPKGLEPHSCRCKNRSPERNAMIVVGLALPLQPLDSICHFHLSNDFESCLRAIDHRLAPASGGRTGRDFNLVSTRLVESPEHQNCASCCSTDKRRVVVLNTSSRWTFLALTIARPSNLMISSQSHALERW